MQKNGETKKINHQIIIVYLQNGGYTKKLNNKNVYFDEFRKRMLMGQLTSSMIGISLSIKLLQVHPQNIWKRF